MLEKKTAYCASPYNSGPLDQATNITNAQTLAKTAAHYGFIPVSPVENFKHLDGDVGEREILELCIGLLLSCKCLYLAPNWRVSTGARIEQQVAEAAHLPIIEVTLDEIEQAGHTWLTEEDKF